MKERIGGIGRSVTLAATLALIEACASPGAQVPSKDGSPNPFVFRSPAAASASPSSTETPSPSPTQKVETQQTQEIALVRFESKEAVAARFGGDLYTRDPNHWELVENNTVAVLIPDSSDTNGFPLLHWGIEHRIRTNGGVVQSYDKIKRTPSGIERFQGNQVLDAQAQAMVVNPNVSELDVMKATIKVAANSADTEALSRKLLDDQRKLEAANQPGTVTLPINECPPAVAGNYSLETIPNAQTVVARYGADAYTSDPSHWVVFNAVNGDHYAHLLPDKSDPARWGIQHRIKTAGAVVQAYDKIKRDKTGREIGAPGPVVNNAQAQALVIHPNVPEADVMEATFRVAVGGATETDALWKDSLIKQRAAEINQQPNTVTLPVNECPTPSKSAPTPSPTPLPTSSPK